MTQQGAFFRGTSIDQDTRFSDKEQKELKRRKFPAEFDQKVDMSKVKFEVIKKWLAKRVTELMDVEDELAINYVVALLEEQNPDPKKIQVQIMGFLGKKAANLMHELWLLMLDAQEHGGIPQTFVEEKKKEIRKRRAEDDRIQAGLALSAQRDKGNEVEQKKENQNPIKTDDKAAGKNSEKPPEKTEDKTKKTDDTKEKEKTRDKEDRHRSRSDRNRDSRRESRDLRADIEELRAQRDEDDTKDERSKKGRDKRSDHKRESRHDSKSSRDRGHGRRRKHDDKHHRSHRKHEHRSRRSSPSSSSSSLSSSPSRSSSSSSRSSSPSRSISPDSRKSRKRSRKRDQERERRKRREEEKFRKSSDRKRRRSLSSDSLEKESKSIKKSKECLSPMEPVLTTPQDRTTDESILREKALKQILENSMKEKKKNSPEH